MNDQAWRYFFASLFFSFPIFGNNGLPRDPNNSPFVVIESAHKVGNDLIVGTCGGTNSFGYIDAPLVRSVVVSAAHCFITARLYSRWWTYLGESLFSIRKLMKANVPWSEERLVALEKYFTHAFASPPGKQPLIPRDLFVGGTAQVSAVDWEKLMVAITTLDRELSSLQAFRHQRVQYVTEGSPGVLPLREGSVKVHPLYLLELLIEPEGNTSGIYDVAVARSDIRGIRSLPLAKSTLDIKGKRLSLNGWGLQIDTIQPGHGDFDSDRVVNQKDLCPWTPLGQAVDADGCADQDKKLTKAFRSGGRNESFRIKISNSMLSTGDGEPEYLAIRENDLKIQDADHCSPGKGDSGTSLLFGNPWQREDSQLPFIAGIYHGSRGPALRPKTGQALSVVARFENLLRPSMQAWLQGGVLER